MADFHKKRVVFQATQVVAPDPAFVLPNSDPPIVIPILVGYWIVQLDGEFFGVLSDADFQEQFEPV